MKPEDGKGIYDSIEIPEELDQIVRQSIAEAEKRRREKEAEEKKLPDEDGVPVLRPSLQGLPR